MRGEWCTDADGPLPVPFGPSKRVSLHTCVECGRRWASPPNPVGGCDCGGTVVCHYFAPGRYAQLRHDGYIPADDTDDRRLITDGGQLETEADSNVVVAWWDCRDCSAAASTEDVDAMALVEDAHDAHAEWTDHEISTPISALTSERPAFIPPGVDVVTCYICGDRIEADRAAGLDVSQEDEYYPTMKPVCPTHDTGGEDDEE